jgi:hypothetical protein
MEKEKKGGEKRIHSEWWSGILSKFSLWIIFFQAHC